LLSEANTLSGTTYSWTVSGASNVSGASAGAGSVISQVLSSTDGVTQGTVDYNITATRNGCSQAIPTTITVTVNPNPALTIDNSDSLICSGDATDITLSSPTDNEEIELTDVKYNGVTVTSGLPLVSGTMFLDGGAIAETLENGTDDAIDVEYEFTIRTTTAVSCPVVEAPQRIMVRVWPRPMMNTSNTATEICSGSQTNIELSSTVTDALIKLESISFVTGVPGDVTGYSSAGTLFTAGTTISDYLVNVTNSPVTIRYSFSVSVAGSGCDDGVGLFTEVVTVNPNPSFTINNMTPEICSGGAVNITLNSTSAGHQINLVSVDYAGGDVTGGSAAGPYFDPANNQITESLTNSYPTTKEVIYTFNVTTPGTSPQCPLVTTNKSTTVIVRPDPTFTVVDNDLDGEICSGEATNIDISSPVTNAVITLTNITVTPNSAGLSGLPSVGSTYLTGSKLSNTITNLTNQIQTINYEFHVSVGVCSNPVPQNIIVVVNPTPSVTLGVAAQTICNGSFTDIDLAYTPSAVSGTTFSWTVDETSNVNNGSADTGGPTTATIAQQLFNSSNTVGTATYTITPIANGCNGISKAIIVTVNPTPTIDTSGDEVRCSGETTDIELTNPNNVSGTTFRWIVLSNTNNVAGALSGTGTTITQDLLIDPGNGQGSVVYRITPSKDGCDGLFTDVEVTVNPVPLVNAGFDYALCEDGALILTSSVSGAASLANWTGGNNPTGFSKNPVINKETITYAFNATDIEAGSVLFTLETNDPDGVGPCSSASDQILVKINKLPVVSFYYGILNLDSIAELDPAIPLLPSPSGGVFTGDGVAPGPIFDPLIAVKNADNFVTYSFTDANGCSNQITNSIFVKGAPTIPPQNETAICYNGGLEILPQLLFPDLGVWSGTGVIPAGGGNFAFDPIVAGVGRHVLTFNIVINGSRGTTTKTIIVTPSAVANFDALNFCETDPIQFKNNSSIDSKVFSSSIVSYDWNFGDETRSSSANPSKLYSGFGDRKVTLKLITESIVPLNGDSRNVETCFAEVSKVVSIGAKPEAEFDWDGVCIDASGRSTTQFDDITKDVFPPTYIIDTYTWDFGDATTITGKAADPIIGSANTSGKFDRPLHVYSKDGVFNVTMAVVTTQGCKSEFTQKIGILPFGGSIFPYFEDFEKPDHGWIAEAFQARNSPTTVASDPRYIPSDTSWILTRPTGANISSASSGTLAWWTGHNQREQISKPFDTYYRNENSVVNGPCYDLTLLKRPMISVDYYSDAEKNLDGVVLQYSTDGGSTWKVIGNDGQGINWYNGRSILGSPGNGENFENFGWTEKQGGWKNARFNLDMIPERARSKVRIRFAFGTNDGNAPLITHDGFAFDNVFVGEKPRNVVVENFINNSSAAALNANDELSNLFVAENLDRKGAPDFRLLQYHTNFPGLDTLYNHNPEHQDARNYYYNNSKVPFAVIDGRLGNFIDGTFAGSPDEIDTVAIDRRALTDPEFTITLDTLTTTVDSVNVSVTLKANIDYPDPVIMQVALVDDGMDRFRNVFKKGLFGREGVTIVEPWLQSGPAKTFIARNSIDIPISREDSLSVIAYVFNKKTRVILQSKYLKLANKRMSVITGINSESIHLKLYPNPSAGISYLSSSSVESGSWQLIDQRGVVVSRGYLRKESELNPAEIDVTGLANGLYIMKVVLDNNQVKYTKLIVNNQK
jgi:hypothetical protein